MCINIVYFAILCLHLSLSWSWFMFTDYDKLINDLALNILYKCWKIKLKNNIAWCSCKSRTLKVCVKHCFHQCIKHTIWSVPYYWIDSYVLVITNSTITTTKLPCTFNKPPSHITLEYMYVKINPSIRHIIIFYVKASREVFSVANQTCSKFDLNQYFIAFMFIYYN